jgi:hypothetical protein
MPRKAPSRGSPASAESGMRSLCRTDCSTLAAADLLRGERRERLGNLEEESLGSAEVSLAEAGPCEDSAGLGHRRADKPDIGASPAGGDLTAYHRAARCDTGMPSLALELNQMSGQLR